MDEIFHITPWIETLESTVTTIERNFALKDEMVSVGYGQKKIPVYEMDRKGFMLLVMGFTGKKAMRFKNDFVDAFDRMEAELLKPKETFKIPQTFSEALMLAAKQAEQIELMEPKAEAHDAYLSTEKNISFTEAAKSLGFRSVQQLTRWFYK